MHEIYITMAKKIAKKAAKKAAKKSVKPGEVNMKKILRNELSFWTKKWKVSSLQIGGAKRAIGSDSVSKVEKYLKSKGLIKK